MQETVVKNKCLLNCGLDGVLLIVGTHKVDKTRVEVWSCVADFHALAAEFREDYESISVTAPQFAGRYQPWKR